jgi:acyl-CoA thioester hydrolase
VAEPFSVRVSVRAYELDRNGHVNNVAYLQYAEHARWEFLRAAGIDERKFGDLGVGPVFLETVIRYRAELYYGDTVDISCAIDWGTGRTFRVPQRIRRADGVLIAEIDSVGGLIDLATRRLVTGPEQRYREVATVPEVLGL